MVKVFERRSQMQLVALLVLLAGCGEDPPPARQDAEPAPEPVIAAEAGADDGGDAGDAEAAEPDGPPRRIFTKRFVVNVRNGASRESDRIGYLRAGSVHQATTFAPLNTEGCRRGWYELEGGGFVCSGRDVIAFDGTRLPERRSRQPDMEAPLPYEYGFVRRRAPMYRNLPTLEEASSAEGFRLPGQGPPPGAPGADGGTAAPSGAEGAAPEAPPVEVAPAPEAPAPEAPAPEAPAPEAPAPEAPAPEAEEEGPALPTPPVFEADAGQPTLDNLLADRESIVSRWLMRGFYVSLDRDFRRAGRRYWRTQANGFVPRGTIVPRSGSEFGGIPLDGETYALPLGFVTRRQGPQRFTRSEEGRFRRARGAPEHRHAFRVESEEEHRNRPIYEGNDEYWYSERDVRIVRASEDFPEELQEGQKWIDVDLYEQTLIAYEGHTPVFVTLVSTGIIRQEGVDGQDHRTPTGIFQISSKHVTHTMDGDNAFDGPYSVDDVPYVMYFQLAYAFHSAFWHNRFGAPKSHGCVNLAPLDARHLFNWADPPLPERWHGVYPVGEMPTTLVRIRGETPRRGRR